jgi:anthranilate phosphoribosyltransferase
MTIAPYIKEIGRGGQGARSLAREQAADLMAQVLDGRVTDLEVGAFALAMRMKGETAGEIMGFLDAAHERCAMVPTIRPVVLLPSYNGARRLPNLTPLLAMRLAQEGAAVLVHGPVHDPKRVTTADIFRDLGLPIAQGPAGVEQAWARREPAFVRIDGLCPPLARLLDVRWVVGLRNSGHTVAKMLSPCRGARALRVVNHTHPEFGELLTACAGMPGTDMVLMRGFEGEPVADPRRAPRMAVWLDGVARPELSSPAHEGVLSELPLLPRTCDAATTALYIQAVMSGEKPAPAPLEQQVRLLLNALSAMESTEGRFGVTA